MSRTKQALKLLKENPGMSQAQAAKALGLAKSVVARAVIADRETAHIRCGTCGQVIPYLKEVLRR